MVVAVILAVSLVILTFVFHFAVLRWLSDGMARIAMTAGVLLIVWSGSFIYIAMGPLAVEALRRAGPHRGGQ